MKRRFILLSLFFVMSSLVFSAVFIHAPAQAASDKNKCSNSVHVNNWKDADHLANEGFYIEQFGSSASYGFNDHVLSLDLGTTGDANYAATRITEIDVSVPVDQRVKCWQPTASKDVVAEYTMKFDQPYGSMLTENVFFWNAPFGQNPIPLSAVGVTRSPGSGGQYAAIIAQDVVFNPDFSISGLFYIVPMPSWLNAADWHTIRVTISNGSAQVEVKQGSNDYTTVLSAPLLHTPEALGLEYSVDNEIFPGFTVPVSMSDGLDLGELTIGYSNSK
jgi:hypothetical protein